MKSIRVANGIVGVPACGGGPAIGIRLCWFISTGISLSKSDKEMKIETYTKVMRRQVQVNTLLTTANDRVR